ncbi:ABC transporter permease [Bacillus piscicola]|uniref:ABC transporter permease n=1 Tax=Bacillus piscicola TaxID=1632684 RepID=UPI001F09FC41|nr:ABC transporter permease [Bacillus piscicola]
MINYIKSENYRLLRKKGLYLTSLICLLLITAAAVVLYLLGQYETNFPYATSLFFYSNVISGSLLILIVAFLFNVALTGKDTSLLKQSISFGVSRSAIFWSKLILTVSYFLLLCMIGMVYTIGLGESLLADDAQSVESFLIASFNMLPIVLGGFFMIHALKMLKFGDVYIIILLLFLFMFSGDLLRMILRPVTGLSELYQYAPSTLLDENLMEFVDQAATFDYRYWVVGIAISAVSLLVGAKRFAKQSID